MFNNFEWEFSLNNENVNNQNRMFSPLTDDNYHQQNVSFHSSRMSSTNRSSSIESIVSYRRLLLKFENLKRLLIILLVLSIVVNVMRLSMLYSTRRMPTIFVDGDHHFNQTTKVINIKNKFFTAITNRNISKPYGHILTGKRFENTINNENHLNPEQKFAHEQSLILESGQLFIYVMTLYGIHYEHSQLIQTTTGALVLLTVIKFCFLMIFNPITNEAVRPWSKFQELILPSLIVILVPLYLIHLRRLLKCMSIRQTPTPSNPMADSVYGVQEQYLHRLNRNNNIIDSNSDETNSNVDSSSETNNNGKRSLAYYYEKFNEDCKYNEPPPTYQQAIQEHQPSSSSSSSSSSYQTLKEQDSPSVVINMNNDDDDDQNCK